jgi:hypothetical protein
VRSITSRERIDARCFDAETPAKTVRSYRRG